MEKKERIKGKKEKNNAGKKKEKIFKNVMGSPLPI